MWHLSALILSGNFVCWYCGLCMWVVFFFSSFIPTLPEEYCFSILFIKDLFFVVLSLPLLLD